MESINSVFDKNSTMACQLGSTMTIDGIKVAEEEIDVGKLDQDQVMRKR